MIVLERLSSTAFSKEVYSAGVQLFLLSSIRWLDSVAFEHMKYRRL